MEALAVYDVTRPRGVAGYATAARLSLAPCHHAARGLLIIPDVAWQESTSLCHVELAEAGDRAAVRIDPFGPPDSEAQAALQAEARDVARFEGRTLATAPAQAMIR